MGKRFLLFAALVASLVVPHPAGALYGLFQQRPPTDSLLFEWPQRGAQPGNQGWTISLVRPNPFYGNSWRRTIPDYSVWQEGATGQPVTEYFGDRSTFAPYGTLFILSNATTYPYGGGVNVFRLESGQMMYSGLSGAPRYAATPAVMYLGDLWDGVYLIAATRGEYGNWGEGAGIWTASFNISFTSFYNPGPPPSTIWIPGISRSSTYSYDLPGMVTHSPALFFNMCYVVNNRRNEWRQPSTIYAYDTFRTPRSLTEVWTVPLQTGAGMDRPIPKGSAPPPADDIYHAVTTPIVDDEYMIVGAQKIGWDEWGNDTTNEAAFFALDTRTGAQKWVKKISGITIMPEPVLAGDMIVFGTSDGRAYALNRVDGNIRLQIDYSARVRGQTQPLNAPNLYDNVKLYGPAVDFNRQFAYFGGSDGRVHRFDLNSGGIVSSPILTYFKTVWQRDGNGMPLLKPVSIGSAPIIFYNSFLFVKCYAAEAPCSKTSDDCRKTCSFLFCLSIPNMDLKYERIIDWNTGDIMDYYMHTDNSGVTFTLQEPTGDNFGWCGFRRGGMDTARAGIPLNNWVGYDYDKTRRMCYITNTGGENNGSYSLNNDSDTNAEEYLDTDLGGVCLTNGWIVAADRGGNVIGIPSDAAAFPFYPTTPSGPLKNPPPPYTPGPQLGEIQVYPNPFNPRKAVGGVMKFRNLPEGAAVEIATLAMERVRLMTARTDNIVRWDGKNESGQEVATGIYIYRIKLPDGTSVSGRLALVRK